MDGTEEGHSCMKALTWQGKRDVRVEDVPDPRIEKPTDAIVRITSTAICGSDLHLYEVLGPYLKPGDERVPGQPGQRRHPGLPAGRQLPGQGRPAPAADHHAGTGGPGDRGLRRTAAPGDLGGPAQRGHAVRLHRPARPCTTCWSVR